MREEAREPYHGMHSGVCAGLCSIMYTELSVCVEVNNA